MMTGKERRFAIWNFETPDYFPVPKCYFWKETIERWYREGLPEGTDPNVHEGIISDDVECVPINIGFEPLFKIEVLECDNDYVVLIDEFGVKKRVRKVDFDRTKGQMKSAGDSSSMAEWLEFPVKSKRDWIKIRNERLIPDLSKRLPKNWDEIRKQLLAKQDHKIINIYDFPLLGTFGALRQLMGYENMVFAMYDEPQLIEEIVCYLFEFWESLFTQLFKEIKVDWIVFFEDMASSQAPLISPELFMRFFGERYKHFCSFLKLNGIKCIEIDSDGNCLKMLPVWQHIGINSISPCQVHARMDVEKLRSEFPDLLLRGGIDKLTLAQGKEAIKEELSKRFKTAWDKCGYIPEIDHLIPPNVSWDNFRYFVEVYRLYGSK